MRVRRLPWAEEFLAQQEVLVKEPSANAGVWRSVLGQEELHVEIGSGKGDYWSQMSQLYPSAGWIGIEKNTSVAALALKKVAEEEHLNRRFICADASDIDTWFSEHEIDVLHLNFSDPWPKKRTSKRRLSHHSFLDKYKKILKDDGRIIMKTDNTQLFEFSLIEFQNSGFILEEVYLDFRKEVHDEDAISEYEAKFMAKGNPIYRGIWRKK